jgi:hypothetical protein
MQSSLLCSYVVCVFTVRNIPEESRYPICNLHLFLHYLSCSFWINSIVEAFVIIKVFRKFQLGFLLVEEFYTKYLIKGLHYKL